MAIDSQTAVRLAHAFARELAYARRSLIPSLLDWDPFYFASAPQHIWESFVADSPFNDLTLIRSCIDRLRGFKDEDVFKILTVLTTWQFFNSNPGLSVVDIIGRSEAERVRTATQRVRFGLELLDLIEEAINSLNSYYGEHSFIRHDAGAVVPERLANGLAELRRRVPT